MLPAMTSELSPTEDPTVPTAAADTKIGHDDEWNTISGCGRRPETEMPMRRHPVTYVERYRPRRKTISGLERRRQKWRRTTTASVSALLNCFQLRRPEVVRQFILERISLSAASCRHPIGGRNDTRGCRFVRSFPVTATVLLLALILPVSGTAQAAAEPASASQKSTTAIPASGNIVQLSPCKAVIDERLVNLETLQHVDGTPRFTAAMSIDDGWSIAFNPCSSFNLPADPHAAAGDQCLHVAVCRYPSSNATTGGAENTGKFYTLGIQRTARFNISTIPPSIEFPARLQAASADATNSTIDGSNDSTSGHVTDRDDVSEGEASPVQDAGDVIISGQRRVEIPVLIYRGIRSMRRWKVLVYLQCDHSVANPNDATFTPIRTDPSSYEHHFSLRHRCCCPDACPESIEVPFLPIYSNLPTVINASLLLPGDKKSSSDQSGTVPPDTAEDDSPDPPPRFLWLILVVNGAIFVVAVMVAGLCCRRGGGLMSSGPYTYIPAIHASRATLQPAAMERGMAANGSVASGLWTGQSVKRSASMSADYRDYSTSATNNSKLPMLDNCVIDIHSIDIGQRLGGGLFGDTYTCEWKDRTVAAKRITVGVHQSQLTPADYEWIVANVTMLSKQRHNNLVTVLGVCIETRQPYVISEFIEGESLRDLMRRSLVEPFGWPQKVKLCIQASDGMAFLHSAKTPILHRDLRSANILVDRNGKVKIVDFGLTKIIQRLRSECDRGQSCYCQKDTSATPASIRWTAPEILATPTADDVTSPEVFTPACDVFSFAMVLWELATCTEPFEDISEETQVLQLILDGTRPSLELVPRGTLPHVKELMKACWSPSPESRPSFKQIALYLKNILQVLTKMSSSQRHRERSDSIISTTTSYLRSALNIANDS